MPENVYGFEELPNTNTQNSISHFIRFYLDFIDLFEIRPFTEEEIKCWRLEDEAVDFLLGLEEDWSYIYRGTDWELEGHELKRRRCGREVMNVANVFIRERNLSHFITFNYIILNDEIPLKTNPYDFCF